MAVVNCLRCGRLLFRPDELLGRHWQCPNCGPTRVSGAELSASAGLAALLEEEYRLSLSSPLPAVDVTPRDSNAEPPVPVDPRFVRRNWLALTWFAVLALLSLGLIFSPVSYLDVLQGSLLPVLVGIVVLAIVVIPVVVMRELRFRQKMEAVQSQLRRAPVSTAPARAKPGDGPDGRAPLPNQGIRAELLTAAQPG